jgi:tetratricopeptide (TPR) repeat protein
MRKSSLLILYIILIINLVFSSPKSLAWWQESTPKTQREFNSEQAEEKFARAINQNLQEQAEELSAQVKILEERNKSLRTELNQISADRQDLLKKLKNYTVHREGLDARILMLEKGIINLNEIKKGLTDENKALSEQAGVLQKELKEQKELELALTRAAEIKVMEQASEEIKAGGSPQEKQTDKLNTVLKKLKEDNSRLKRDLKNALNEVSSSNASLGKLKKEVAFTHYNLGVMFYQSGNYNQSLLEYQKALEALPDDARTHYGMALIYDEHKKNKEKAIHHYRKYLEIEPNAEDAAEVKGRITEKELEQKIWAK